MIRWLKNRLIRWLGAKWYVQTVSITEAPLEPFARGPFVSAMPREEEYAATRAIERLIKELKHTGHLQWIELPPEDSHYLNGRRFVLKIRVI